jgi:DNA-directed RNA polymerase subunit RPC12/RpoP
MTSKVRAFPCRSCGAKLSFAPGTETLKCPYCGTGNDIPKTDDAVEELALEDWLKQLEQAHETHQQEQVKCQNCGGEQTLAANLFASACTFCGSPITSKSYAQRLIKPKALVPFKVTKLQAQDKWRAWIRGLWLAPSALKNFAQGDGGIKGIYIPYWTFDAQTYTNYAGQRGDDYTENYETTNDKGDRVTESRTRTDWTNVSGNVSFFHDDVLVPASNSFADAAGKYAGRGADVAQAQKVARAVGGAALGGAVGALSNKLAGGFRTWNTKELVPYQEEYIAGFQAEAYQIGLKDAFVGGKKQIDNRVEELVCADIGGDHQRITSVNTQYSHLTFKHILLPMWVSAYLFSGKIYRFLVNGQTGEVVGESPKSGWKIFFLVCGILLVLFIFLAIFGGKHR